MATYPYEDRTVKTDVPPVEGALRGRLSTLETLVGALEDAIDAIDTRLFGERPQEVEQSAGRDASISPVERSVESVIKQMIDLTQRTDTIRNRL
jgi:hypothetical protein